MMLVKRRPTVVKRRSSFTLKRPPLALKRPPLAQKSPPLTQKSPPLALKLPLKRLSPLKKMMKWKNFTVFIRVMIIRNPSAEVITTIKLLTLMRLTSLTVQLLIFYQFITHAQHEVLILIIKFF